MESEKGFQIVPLPTRQLMAAAITKPMPGNQVGGHG